MQNEACAIAHEWFVADIWCCCSQFIAVVAIAQCDVIHWRIYAILIWNKKRGGVDNTCCYYTHIVVAILVTWCSSSKLVVIFAFEQIGSLSFYRHRFQLIVICHYDDSQYMKHLCTCLWVASCWQMLLSQHYCCCRLWVTRYVIATVHLTQLL